MMTREEKAQRTKEIIVKMFRLFESEHLTVKDAGIILQIAKQNLSNMSIPVTEPAEVSLSSTWRLPEFATPPTKVQSRKTR